MTQLNVNQLEMIGRIETARRRLSDATTLILNGAAPIAIQQALNPASSEIHSAHDELNFYGNNWDA